MAKTSNLDVIGDKVITMLSRKNEARERGLPLSREAIRHCANAIRAIHRAEFARAEQLLEGAHIRIEEMKQALAQHPDLRYGGFVFDAEKEYAEARATMALVRGLPLSDPDELGVDYVAYVNGLGEAIGEMRRHLLDELRRGDPVHIEDLLAAVDDIYNLLISVDFPDAITSGLRRTTDVARGVLEKTRGDITLAFQQRALERRLREIEASLGKTALPAEVAAAVAQTKRPTRRRPAAPPALPQEVAPAEPPVAAAPVAPVTPAVAEMLPEAEAQPNRRRRRRRHRPATALAPVEGAPAPVAAAPVPEAPAPSLSTAPETAAEVAPKRRRRHRRRRPATALAPVEGAPAPVAAAPVPEAPAPSLSTAPEIAGEVSPKRRRRRRRRPATALAPVEGAPAPVAAAPVPEPELAPTFAAEPPPPALPPPRRRWWALRLPRKPAETGTAE